MTIYRYIYHRFVRDIAYCVVALLMASTAIQAQTYGLQFVGHEDIQDSRTSLNLTPDQPLCLKGNVEVSFDLTLVPNYQTYFGYIFRIIQDDKQNLDLLYDQKSRSFKLIIGGRLAQSVIQIDSVTLFNKWNHFTINWDLNQRSLLVSVNNKVIIKDHVTFNESGCFKLFFGSNEFGQFKSKDLPPMNIKDIVVTENGRRTHDWPLQGVNGITTKDEVDGQIATVKNPVWIKSLHTEWKKADQLTLKGYANVAFDPITETVYVTGSEKLYQYAVSTHQASAHPHKNPPQNLLRGSQAIYNPFTGRLYSYFVDQKSVYSCNPATSDWTVETITPNAVKVTEYWHANKFISPFDSSLYILGGYGQLRYKNSILRYHFASRTWDTLSSSKNVYTPRYLAALGTTSSIDTAYMIGGYGSLTGEQMLNPKNSYDLLEYLVRKNTFRKVYELTVPKTDFAFANSLMIDAKSKQYYGLIFPNQQFKAQLQLIRGSLTTPSYEVLGTPIPYSFHDIHSYADLYYCPVSQKLIAVTLYQNEETNTTDVKLYSISFPPNALNVQAHQEEPATLPYWWFPVAILAVGGAVFLYTRRNRQLVGKQPELEPTPFQQQPLLVDNLTQPALLITPEIPTSRSDLPMKLALTSSIFFFGNFQVLDHSGNDITKSFTPLLKELFLLLSLNSLGKQRGVATEKLNEILWPDKSGREASNNRSVNITKLRNLLEKVEFCSLSKDSGYWKIEFNFNQQLYVDYERYTAIINDKTVLTKQAIIELGELTKRGPFLQNTEYYWLDDFKADISNKIINTFLKYANTLTISEEPELLIQITNYIFDYDPVNEDAIILKCKALSLMGKHTLAKNTFERFIRDYKAIYGEEYEQSFSAIID
ncbi:galactose oxidase [Spirosoma foliorum]|uniref:Galactose oxidase n=1 Tax=Spirosoma foliorum TaxID=2710596 RepID=A0A7G5H6C8_9BACT|nr:galactose oxidase [Spirosoma foliorum]QMW06670.1 galactose oxidase [Spirosoma foliorum]